MADKKTPRLELVATDHGMNIVAETLHGLHRDLCAQARISPWEFCVALANLQARILAGSKDMPEAKAMERIEGLRHVTAAAYRDCRHGNGPAGTS